VKEFTVYRDFLYVLEAHPLDPFAYIGEVHIFGFNVTDTYVTSSYKISKSIAG
jgi:hypothetical protein